VREGRAPFKIYRRKTRKTKAGRPVYRYYFQLWDSEAQAYSTAQSTGQTTRAAAETWLAAHLSQEEESTLTVEGFSRGLFAEGSDYLTWRAQRGREMSWNHRTHCASYVERYISPYFKKTYLADLSVLRIEAFQSWLLKQPGARGEQLSLATANHVVLALRLVVKWAIRQRLLSHDPFVGVEALAALPRRRGIFTIPEVEAIFRLGPEGWPDPGARLLNALACACGLRKGELQGLRRESVQETALPDGRKAGVLLIDRSWERSGRLKAPKSGHARLAPVPPALYADLLGQLERSPWKQPEHFLFYSADPGRPVSHHKIDDDFERALTAAGIAAGERKARALSFHSWRHFCNSLLVNRGLPVLRAQQVIGHTSLKMTENYLHPGQDFSDVLAIQGELFSGKAGAPVEVGEA
jgi:integrase